MLTIACVCALPTLQNSRGCPVAIFQPVMRAFFCRCNQKSFHSSVSVCVSHRHNERNFNEVLCKGSEDLPALCSPKPICHAYFIQRACITSDRTLISHFFLPLIYSVIFSRFMASYLPKHALNIHTRKGQSSLFARQLPGPRSLKGEALSSIHIRGKEAQFGAIEGKNLGRA